MPIEREDDPRIAWLAIPLSAVGGFVLGVLVAAAVGASAGWAVAVGGIGTGLSILLAVAVLGRTAPSRGDTRTDR